MDDESRLRSEVLREASGHILARALHTAVELTLADRCFAEAKTPEELAGECRADATAVGRLMHFLARHGYFSVAPNGRYAPTAAGAMLSVNAAGHAAAVIRSLGSREVWKAFERLPDAIASGEPSEHRRGGRVYAPIEPASHQAAFDEAMAGFHWGEAEAVAEAIAEARHVAGAKCVIDVGGGSGGLLTAILGRHKHLNGIIFDRPGISSVAKRAIKAAGLSDRCRFRGGNFFEGVPAGGDVYILSHILHDWADEEARAILHSCRRASVKGALLLIVEALRLSREEDDYGLPADLLLLANTEGRLRTMDEYRALLASSGFDCSRVIGTAAPVSLVEAVAR